MITVIIPAHNARSTLEACLGAVSLSRGAPEFEVIVVDDGSTDGSPDLAASFPCRLVRLRENRGRSHARNVGAALARPGILAFLDSDVVVPANALRIIADCFSAHPEVSAASGLLDESCPHPGFFSQYKNLYMHHVFSRLPRRVSFLYGSLCAVRSEHFEPFNESLSMGEDTELGQRLSAGGRVVVLLKELRLTHLKAFDFKGIVRNDFRIPYSWAHLFLANRGLAQLLKGKRFAHAQGGQLGSVLSVPLAAASALLTPWVPAMLIPLAVFLTAHILLNARFHGYLLRKKGLWFAFRATVFTAFDQTVMFSGIVAGVFHFLRGSLFGQRPKATDD